MYNSPPAKRLSAYKAAPRNFVTSAPQCPRCDKSVYAAEQVLGPGGREYHKACLTCIACKKTVQPGNFMEHEGDPYCKHCYAKQHGPKGLGYGGAMTGDYVDPILSRSPYSSPARGGGGGAFDSHRTSGAFEGTSTSRYGNLESPTRDSNYGGAGPSSPRNYNINYNTNARTSIESPVGMYRSSRLQELEDSREDDDVTRNDTGGDMDVDSTLRGDEEEGSSRRINSNQQAEAPDFDDDMPRSMNLSQAVSPTKPRAFPSATSASTSNSFRGSPLKHSLPSAALPEPPLSPSRMRPLSPTSSIGGNSATGSSASATTSGPSTDNHSNIGVGYKSNLGLLQSSGPDLCRRCQKAVYFAEQVMAGGHKWHKRCLRCATCGKALDSHLQEKDNLPYCKRCYDEQWGLKSQGFVLRPGLH